MLVSIIIPTYNSENYIDRCIQSLSDQKFRDFEIVVQDGGSTDRTIEKLTCWKLQDPTLHLSIFQEKDAGIYDAMNRGIEKAAGKWLYFLGSDDYLIDHAVLLSVSQELLKDDVDFIYGNVNSPVLGNNYDGPFDRLKIRKKNIAHQSIFYRQSIFEKLGKYDTRYKIFADWDFNIRCFFSREIRIIFTDRLIAFFSDEGISHKLRDPVFEAEKNNTILKVGIGLLPYSALKYHCKSNAQFVGVAIRKFVGQLGFKL